MRYNAGMDSPKHVTIDVPAWPVWTSLVFVIPGAIAIGTGMELVGLLCIVMAPLSLAYHRAKAPGPDWWWGSRRTTRQDLFLYADTALGLVIFALMAARILALVSGRYAALAGAVLVAGLYCLLVVGRQYEARHGFWHLLAGAFLTWAILNPVS